MMKNPSSSTVLDIEKNPAQKQERSEVDITDSPMELDTSCTTTGTTPPLARRPWFDWRSATFIAAIQEPYDYPRPVKWTITSALAVAATVAPTGPAIFYPAVNDMAKDLGVSVTVINLTLSFYLLAMSVFPLWWSAFSEHNGRRIVYLVSFFLHIIFSVLSGLSQNVPMLIVFRILSGGMAASGQSVGAGTLADIWKPAERGRAMGIFYLGPLIGPMLSTVIGGALTDAFGWRSTMWFLSVYGGAVFLVMLCLLPETLRQKVSIIGQQEIATADVLVVDGGAKSTKKAANRVKETGRQLKKYLIDPFKVVAYLGFPAVLISIYYASITFGSLYVINMSLTAALSGPMYGYSALLVGILFLPGSVGYFVASIWGGPWIDRIMIKAAEKAGRRDENGDLVYLPEDRMRENAWISATLYPVSFILYGWTAQYGVNVSVPLIATATFGLGAMLVFSATTTMLTEFMPNRSSSGVALNNFVRNIFSCVGSIVVQPLIDAIGHGWLTTAIALLAWITGNLCIWLLRRNSQKWRQQMEKALGEQS